MSSESETAKHLARLLGQSEESLDPGKVDVVDYFYQQRPHVDARKTVVGLLRPVIEFRKIKTELDREQFDVKGRQKKYAEVRRFLLETAVAPWFVKDCITDPKIALKHAEFLRRHRAAGGMASEPEAVDGQDPLHFIGEVVNANSQVQRGVAPASYGFIAAVMEGMTESQKVVFARKLEKILEGVNREENNKPERPRRRSRLLDPTDPRAQPIPVPGETVESGEACGESALSEEAQEKPTAGENAEGSTQQSGGGDSESPAEAEPGPRSCSAEDNDKPSAITQAEAGGHAPGTKETQTTGEGASEEDPVVQRAKRRIQQYKLRPGDPGFKEAVDEMVADSERTREYHAKRAREQAEEYMRELREQRGTEAATDSSEGGPPVDAGELDPVSARRRRLEIEFPALDHTVWDSKIVRLEDRAFQRTLLTTLEQLVRAVRCHEAPSERSKMVLSPFARVHAMQSIAQDFVLEPRRVERCLRDPEELWRYVELLTSLTSSLKKENVFQGGDRYAKEWGDELLQLVTRLDLVNSSMKAWRCVVGNLTPESRARVEESLEGLLAFLGDLVTTEEGCETHTT